MATNERPSLLAWYFWRVMNCFRSRNCRPMNGRNSSSTWPRAKSIATRPPTFARSAEARSKRCPSRPSSCSRFHFRHDVLLHALHLLHHGHHHLLHLIHRVLHHRRHFADHGLARRSLIKGDHPIDLLLGKAFLINPHIDRLELVPIEQLLHKPDYLGLPFVDILLHIGWNILALCGLLDRLLHQPIHLRHDGVNQLPGLGRPRGVV